MLDLAALVGQKWVAADTYCSKSRRNTGKLGSLAFARTL